MEWQQIVGFRSVARHGSFTLAARETGRTQSALSQQVRALEEELGCRLLVRRGSGGTVLTAEGRSVLAFAAEVLARRERLDAEIADHRELRRGRVALAAPLSALWHLLPRRLKAFCDRYPGVEISLHDFPHHEIGRRVAGGEYDLGITLESALPGTLESIRWKELAPHLVTPLGHPLARRAAVTLEEAARYPLILPPPDSDFRRAGALKSLDPAAALESSNVELNAVLVREGIGLAFATVAVGEEIALIEGVALVPLEGEGADRSWLCLCAERAGRRSPATEAMLDHLVS